MATRIKPRSFLPDFLILIIRFVTDKRTFFTEHFQNSWLNAVKSNEIVLLLFDISNFDSFQWIVDRAHLIHQLKKIPPSVILIGTKYDLDWKRDVEAEDAYQLAEHFKWQYVEISAADQSIADHVSSKFALISGRNIK